MSTVGTQTSDLEKIISGYLRVSFSGFQILSWGWGAELKTHNLAMCPWPLSVNFLIWKMWDSTVASKGSCNMWSFTLVANAGVVILSRHLQSSTQEDHPHQSLNKNFALAHGGVLL